jgi:hypothetical protein
MEYFWKENKKYLIAVGAAVLFVILFQGFILGPARAKADQVARKRIQDEKALRARVELGVADEDQIGVAKIEIKRTRDLLASLQNDMAFKEAPRYRKPEGQTWAEHWNAEKLEVDRELQKLVRGMQAPRSFLPNVDDPSEDLARELLLRLAAVYRLVQVAVDAKVERIDVVDMLPVSSAGTRKDEPVTQKGVFLNSYMVHMAFKGDQQSVFKVLQGVQKKGAGFLSVHHFEVDRRDPTKDYLDAVIRVNLLRVDEKAPIEVKEEKNP